MDSFSDEYVEAKPPSQNPSTMNQCHPCLPANLCENPLDLSFMKYTPEEWSPPHLKVTLFNDPNGLTGEVVDLLAFIKEDPHRGKLKNIKADKRMYFPPSVHPGEDVQKHDGSGFKHIPTNVAEYVNYGSCFDNGYQLRTNGFQKPVQKIFHFVRPDWYVVTSGV